MLFHVGTLWRLYELGLLTSLKRISSVSGGSITAAVTALAWPKLDGTTLSRSAFEDNVAAPIRRLAGKTIDKPSILGGIFLPGSISDRVVAAYRKDLFGNKTLQDLPDSTRFVINATNLQTAVLWRFSKPYKGDRRVGRNFNPTTDLATADAASSAFPPFLSPRTLRLDPNAFQVDPTVPNQAPPYTSEAILSDGGVYDNLGLETVWKRYRTVLVSDAGMSVVSNPNPATDWAFGSKWVTDIIDGQVRSLRKRQLLGSLTTPQSDPNWRKGAYWSVRGDIADYPARSTLNCPVAATSQLAAVPTRLAALSDDVQQRLVNWGYAICDVALRSYVDPTLAAASAFPYNNIGV